MESKVTVAPFCIETLLKVALVQVLSNVSWVVQSVPKLSLGILTNHLLYKISLTALWPPTYKPCAHAMHDTQSTNIVIMNRLFFLYIN